MLFRSCSELVLDSRWGWSGSWTGSRWMRRLPNPIPWTDVAGYAAIAFVTVYAVLVIKALIWPWEQ